MEYGELSKDTTNEIVAKRIELENREKEAHSEYKKAESNWNNARRQLEKLQKECKHEHAVIKHGWQGGGIYFCRCTCPECGKSGDRYIPQYHMHMNNEWYKTWKDTQHQITLEKAIEIGKEIGKGFIHSDYWWGEVEDYDKLIKDTSEGWV